MYRLISYVFNKDNTVRNRFTETCKDDAALLAILNYYKCNTDFKYPSKGEIALAQGVFSVPETRIDINIIRIS